MFNDNPYYILYEQFGRCGLAMGQMQCSTLQNVLLDLFETLSAYM